MAKVVIDSQGTKFYYNDNDQLHREDGPAIITVEGHTWWLLNDAPISFDGNPTEVFRDGKKLYYTSTTSRENAPAIMYPNGRNFWAMYGLSVWPKL